MHGWNDRQHRLMIVSGRTGCARLLVVPSSTSVNLGGRLVIRRAAAMDPGAEHDSSMCDIADAVIRAAEAECSLWSAQLLEAAAKVEASAPDAVG